MRKKTICVDFDGVLNSYKSGWGKGVDDLPDPPVEGAIDWLEGLVAEGCFNVCIYSSRSKEKAGIDAMRLWLLNNGLLDGTLDEIEFPTQKPPAYLTIDDRAWRFDGPGTFPTAADIDAFQPWFKRKVAK